MGITLGKSGFSMSQPLFGMQQLLFDVLQVKTTNILQFDPLEQIPDALLGQYRSNKREAKTVKVPFPQEFGEGTRRLVSGGFVK
jgi:hypothetical protein